jgi:thioredoxin-like negative regulator of GroEL
MRRARLRWGTTAVALLLGFAGAGRATAQAPPANPVRSPGNADWARTVDEAGARAAAEGKFVFIEFDSPDCGDCQRMDRLLYPAFDFEALLIPMVPVKVSIESAEGQELARRHGIRQTPAVLIKSPEGRMVVLMEGFTSAPDFYSHIRKELDAYRAFARKAEAQDISRLPAREALDTGRELFQRGDSASALPRLKRAVAAPGATAAMRDEARELLAAAQLDAGDTAASRQTIERLIETTRDSGRKERAELFRAQIPLAENKPDEAYALYKKFEKDHPDSRYLPQVRALADRLAGQKPKS